MVEAVGIEPTSENLHQRTLHACPAFIFSFRQAIETGKAACLRSLRKFLDEPLKESSPPKIPLFVTPSPVPRAEQGSRLRV